MGAIREVLVPDIGDFSDIPVIEVMVKPGDRVKPEDSLIVLESDKATLDVPAPFGGAVKKLKVQVGDRVSEGTAILELEAEEVEAQLPAPTAPPPEAAKPETAAVIRPETAATPEAAPATQPETAASAALPPSLPHASPAIRRFARELGVELCQVRGSGPSQRILINDVQSFVRAALSAGAPSGAPAAAAPPRTATHFDEADVTDLEAFREEVASSVRGAGFEVTLAAFLLKAVVPAVQKFQALNAGHGDDPGAAGSGCHLGFAIDTPNGRVVPLIRDVDRKGVLDLAREIEELGARARDNRLEPADLARGAFSIASLGSAGGTGFTPVIDAPAVAVLGVTRPQPKLVEREGKAVTRCMLPLCLSYDSRVIDATAAARFTAGVAALLGDLRRASL